jgi:large subunit ribosomal protein L25
MERQTLQAEKREDVGKGAARSLRRSGSIPAVIYRGNKSTPLKLDAKELSTFIKATSGDQVLVNLKLGKGKKLALLKDFQTDPVGGELLHVDFFEVSLKEKVKVAVHIALKGEPIGVKRDKGILQYGLRDIEVECLPGDIPGQLELDISEVETGKSLHVKDLEIPDNVTLLSDLAEVVVLVAVPKVEVEEVPEEEEEEVVAEGEGEPEVAEEKGKAKEEKKEEGEKKEGA